MRLLPEPAGAIRRGVESVVEEALGYGAQEPPWVAFDDGSDRWIALVAARPPGERAQAVVATSSDRTLASAHRLGIGGAFRLPSSLHGAREALTAAHSAKVLPAFSDAAVLGLLNASEPVHVVSLAGGPFWCCQLGETALAVLLSRLASVLEVPPAIVPWPALLVGGAEAGRIQSGWNDLASELDRALPDLMITPAEIENKTVAAGTYAALLAGENQPLPPGPSQRFPVHELPGGGQLGWWAPADGELPGDGWLAMPAAATSTRCSWRIAGGGVEGTVQDVVTTADLRDAQGAMAARVPGWLAANLRPGTPAGLLVSDLADAAAQQGLPLWIPNVDAEALQMVLRLPGTLWVDGPAVPRSAA